MTVLIFFMLSVSVLSGENIFDLNMEIVFL